MKPLSLLPRNITACMSDAEEKDATIENLRNELESATANIAELLDLIRLAHEWGANGVKGYSADKAMTFRDEAENILSNAKGDSQSPAKNL